MKYIEVQLNEQVTTCPIRSPSWMIRLFNQPSSFLLDTGCCQPLSFMRQLIQHFENKMALAIHPRHCIDTLFSTPDCRSNNLKMEGVTSRMAVQSEQASECAELRVDWVGHGLPSISKNKQFKYCSILYITVAVHLELFLSLSPPSGGTVAPPLAE
jgi:hypothetical protein